MKASSGSAQLTPKQERFVEEFLVDACATQAAIRAGYSAKTANRIASELLGKPGVQEALAKGRAVLSEKTQITAEWVLERLRHEATLTGEESTHSARVSALGLLGKHLGMFTDRVKLEGEVSVPKSAPDLNLKDLSDEELKRFTELLQKTAITPPAGGT